MVIADENNVPTIILDYAFGQSDLEAEEAIEKDPLAEDTDTGLQGVALFNQTPPKSNGSANAPWSRKVGPITISSLGLSFNNSILQITLDASINLGGLEGYLKGFGFRVQINNMKSISLPDTGPVLLLSGVGLELNRPPVELAGMLLHQESAWLGAVAVGFTPYNFAAAGYYGTFDTINPTGSYKTMFLLLETSGPLIELEFASLTGLTAGFGYNVEMRLPTVENVTEFPFLALEGGFAQTDPLKTLTSLVGQGATSWFSPAKGPIWIAAGLAGNAIQMLDIKSGKPFFDLGGETRY